MAHMFGWKDILRPIRDGYRHLFPPPDTGPSPEERERQRESDRLKGFTYFDTFTQLEAWTESDSDPLQRANTPLLVRPGSIAEDEKATVLLCHDYSGNYHEYEAVQGIGVGEKSYTCEYLQFVDTFVYFSHKLVCVPPPSWMNALHRNGVKALGTVLVESQTKDSENLFRYTKDGSESTLSFPLAQKLADIAKHYGFDGWLVNIEKPFSKNVWDPHVLESFLRQLREELGPSRTLIWYDALTVDNKIAYQNALTAKNALFSKACGNVLTNYSWKETDAWRSKTLAEQHDFAPEQVYFGVDVWAQNKSTRMHPRVTYPEKGGGGTHTGMAVNKLAEVGLSVGIFAPAWSFEHFPRHGRDAERAMWDGYVLPDDISCSCGDVTARHPPNRGYSIRRSARRFPAGSERFFYTNFSRGFGRHGEQERDRIYNGKKVHSQVGSQSILPDMRTSSVVDDQVASSVNMLSHRLEDLPGRTQLVVEAQSATSLEHTTTEMYERWLPMFNLDMLADGSLHLTITARRALQAPDASTGFFLKYNNDTKLIDLKDAGDVQTIEVVVDLEAEPGVESHSRLQQLGVYLRALPLEPEPVRILEVQEIRIIPRSAIPRTGLCSIGNVRVEKRGNEETEHCRLCWTHSDGGLTRPVSSGVPYSDITGPFSHFEIFIDGLSVGRAHAPEFIMPKACVEDMRIEEREVRVNGIGFDGGRLADSVVAVQI